MSGSAGEVNALQVVVTDGVNIDNYDIFHRNFLGEYLVSWRKR